MPEKITRRNKLSEPGRNEKERKGRNEGDE